MNLFNKAPSQRQRLARRQRIVQILRFLLPLVACGLVVGFWMGGRSPAAQKLLKAYHANLIRRLHITTHDGRGNYYDIKAAKAQEDSPQHVSLKEPEAMVTLTSKDIICLRSHQGLFDRGQRLLHLEGGVRIDHSQGYTLEMGQVWVNMANQTVHTDDPVLGWGPFGQIQSKGFKMERKNQSLTFLGRPKLIILEKHIPRKKGQRDD
jgi:lipopolysaccharide export system protein LptC